MAEETIVEQTPPQDVPYVDRVYSALKDNLSGFDKTPEQFKTAMKDSGYAAKAYAALKDNLTGFDKSENDFYSQVGLKKKDGTPDLPNGVDLSGSGLNPFQHSQAPTDLTPVLPEHRDEVRARQQEQIQAQSDNFKQLRSHLDPETQKNFDKAIEMSNAKHPDVLGVPTKQEIDHYNFMQTPIGKTLGAVAYVGSGATHGVLQIAKGVAHVANMANNPVATMAGIDPTDPAFNYLDKKADFGLTPNDKAQIENMTIPTLNGHKVGIGAGIAAAGQMANFAPSIAAGESAGIPKTLLYLQGLGQAKEQADKMTDLNPMAKEALIQGGGLVNMALADFGGKIFGKGVSNAVKDKVVTGIATDALKEAAEKGLTEDGYKALLEGKAQSFAEKFDRAPSEVLKHYVDAAKTFTKLNVGNYAVHKAVDAINDKPVFNENLGNLAETESNTLTKQVPMFGSIGALGAVSKLTPNSGYENDVTKSVINDPSPANIDNIKYSIEQHGHENGWSSDEIKATHDHIDKIAKAVQSLPTTVKDRTKAVGLVLDRNELQSELDQSVGEREKLDSAVAEIPSPKEQYLTDKIEQANDKLRGLVTEKKPTYSKGLAVNKEEGKFFKTTGDVKEEITPARYDLENTEREAKKQIDEPATPSPEIAADVQEQPAEPAIAQEYSPAPVETPVEEVKPETTKNSPIKSIENESTNEGNGEKSSQEGSEKRSAQSKGKTNETVRPEKSDVVKSGEDKTKPDTIEQKKEITTFKTAKGSTYKVNEDGTTIRDKAERSDVGHEGQKGIQPSSTKTVYVTKDDLGKLDLVQAIHPKDDMGFTLLHGDDGKVAVAEFNKKTGESKIIPRTVVEPKLEPEVGLYPVESWKGISQPHFGNEIVEVNKPSMGVEHTQSSLSDEKSARLIELRKKFVGQLNDITRIPTLLADKEFREYAGLVLEDTLGDFKVFSKRMIDEVGERIKDHLPGLFKELGGKMPEDKETVEQTGIRHADTAKERADEGKASDVPKKDRSRETIEAKGKELIDEDPDYANRIAKEIIDKERPATAVEQAALEYRKTQLKNERRRIIEDDNQQNDTENEIKLAKITDEIALNQKATDIAGSELGSGLGYRTQLMNEDYSTETVLGRARVANGGEELEPKDRAELEKRTKRIEELENERDDLVEKLKKQAENRLVDKVHRTANFEERQAKREVTKASLRKEREGLLAELQLMAKKSRGTLGANKIPVEMIGPLTKLARNYVLDGATTLSAVVDKLYSDLKDHIEDVSKEDIAALVKDNFDKYLTEQNSLRLGRAKKLQQTKLEKLKSEDYEKKTYAKILVDNDYLNIRAEINREQQKVNKKLADIENSKKSVNRRIVETAVKFARQAKLASVTVLGKLAATGLATVGIKPVQELVGKGLSAVLPRVAEKSSVEGSVSRKLLREANTVTEGAAIKSISEAIARAATVGMKDSWQEMTGAGSNLTNLYKERGATLPSEAKEFFGHLHSAIKAPIKRFAWELSYAKRTAKMIEAGLDPLDPINDAQNRLNAYKDGERAIFMGDNTLSKIYENNVGALEKSSSSINRTAAAAFRILLPFVKVPSNIVLEGAKYSFGSVSGLARLGRAMTKGMDNLTPEEADIILEHLKKGSVGGAALAYGFFNPNQFGGFYQQGEKKKVGPKHIKIGDVNIPEFLVEHPVYTAAQVGANFRHLLDKYRHKDDKIPTAALATMAGLGYNVPQANEIKRLVDMTADIKSMDKWKKFSGETLRGAIEPAALIQLAEITDVKEGAKTAVHGLAFTEHTQQKRQPKLRKKQFMKYLLQMVESGIPGLRKNVPKKH